MLTIQANDTSTTAEGGGYWLKIRGIFLDKLPPEEKGDREKTTPVDKYGFRKDPQ